MSANKESFRKFKEKISNLIFRNSIFVLILLIIFSIFSRFLLIGQESLWLDEAWSLNLAREAKFPNIFNYFFNEKWPVPHPFMYFFILNIWVTCFGTTEVALRSLSAVFGIIIILLVYYIGSKEFNKKIGLISSFFVLLSPLNLYYSQEARMYTLTALLILICVYYNYKLTSSIKPIKYSALYSFFTLLLLYTDYLGFIAIGLNFVFSILFFINKYRNGEKIKLNLFFITSSYLVIVFLYLPWISNVFYQFQGESIAWITSPDIRDFVAGFVNIFGIFKSSYGNEISFLLPSKVISLLMIFF